MGGKQVVGVVAIWLFATLGAAAQSVPNSVALIAADMALPHAAKMHGVPDYFDWADGPRLNMGLRPGRFRAFLAWGQVYEAASGSAAVNTRIQIRNIRGYYLSNADGRWHVLQRSRSIEGEAYTEDFANNENHPANARPAPEGGLSVRLTRGYNFHFWPTVPRVNLPPVNDIKGIFTTVQARLVLDNPAAPDDRAKARYLLGMGADYWLDQDIQFQPNYASNDDIGIGRHRFVTRDWQWFNMTTLSLAELRGAPPPL